MYEKIITHSDFDGIVSGAICSVALGIRKIYFAGPSTITKSLIPISENDIVCDLPYPLSCGLWFDHHEGNLQELRYRKIDPATIRGRAGVSKSCARIVFEYFSERTRLPEFIEDAVKEADIIDSFEYRSIEDWRKESPGKIIDNSLNIKESSRHTMDSYMRAILFLLTERSIEEVANTPKARERFEKYKREEEGMLRLIKESSTFMPNDQNCEIVLLDLTKYSRMPSVIKNLAYLIYPDALAVLQISNLFERNTKKNDLSFSMSLSIALKSTAHSKDVGEIMRTLNIGDGHKGAGAGTVYSKSKQEMLEKKALITEKIFRLWKNQLDQGVPLIQTNTPQGYSYTGKINS